MSRATCAQCGATYYQHGPGYICGLCRVRGIIAPPTSVLPTYKRVRIIAQHSSFYARVGIGREMATRWEVEFGDGRKCSFRREAVEVIGCD